ncbi:MAG: tail fiber domain-containing protein [Muribaculaceae bacterium]|nr:tail fiber domain-containing protein [Muribaculaceae bacterium]
MKQNHLILITALLLATVQLKAQITVKTTGQVMVGEEYTGSDHLIPPSQFDTITVLKVFGPFNMAAGGRLRFGDANSLNAMNVAVGEAGTTDTDQLWLHGKKGTYLTSSAWAQDTVAYYDPLLGNFFKFNCDVKTSGVFIQSDSRFKEDIEPVEDVLSSLSGLEPVTYHLKPNFESNRNMGEVYTEKDKKDKEFFDKFYQELQQDPRRYGFLAQNVQEAFPLLVRTDKEGYRYVDYIGLIPILVQSINELQAKIARLNGETPIVSKAPTQSTMGNELSEDRVSAKLFQNAPNPFSNSTEIRYTLPESVTQAVVYIYDLQGKQVKSIAANGRGTASVTLNGNDLSAGMYIYALVADGQEIDSKRMILTK